MRRPAACFHLLVLVLAPAGVRAQDARPERPGFDVEHLKAAPGARDLVVSTSPEVAGDLQVGGGILLNYSRKPLAFVRRIDGDLQRQARPVIDHHVVGDVYASIGLLDRMEVAVAVPVGLFQDGAGTREAGGPPLTPTGLGDVRLGLKVLVLEPGTLGVGLVFAPRVSFPSGDPEQFRGDGFVTVSPAVALGRTGRRLRGTLEAGLTVRERSRFLNVEVGQQLFYRAGGGWQVVPDTLEVMAEVFGLTTASTALSDDGDGVADESPLEALVAVRHRLTGDLFLTVGAATGLVAGYGTPQFRIFAGSAWVPSEADGDGDGLLDRDDACVDRPEDHDGFEDGDGCPDPDNDGDGTRDTEDRCPNAPEDRDGFEDGDGCPDPDNDGDGLPDREDRCPDEPEDADGFHDEDGCPDADDDGDGVSDKLDRCPEEPEDVDGFEDDDGCPEPDRGPPSAVLGQGRIETSAPVQFEPGSTVLVQESLAVLDAVAAVLHAHPALMQVRVAVHTDGSGEAEAERALSRRRALSLIHLLARRGVDPSRFVAQGFGADRPLTTEATAAARAKNARVEFQVVEARTR